MLEPLVSVLIPCYNCESYIIDCINSVIEQSYQNIEILVCDDGSTDDSYNKVIKLAQTDKRIKVFKNEVNSGKVKTINRLILESKGHYISFLDSDDFVTQHKIKLQVNFMLDNPDHSLCGTAFARVNTEGDVFDEIILPRTDSEIRNEILSGSGMPVCCGSVLAVGEFVRKVGGYRSYFEDCSGEDVDFVARLLDYGKGTNLDDVCYFYRYRAFSLTRRVFSSVKQRHSHEIIGFLAKNRWDTNSKVDYLTSDIEALNDYIALLAKPYESDPTLIHRQMAFDHALNGSVIPTAKAVVKGLSIHNIINSVKCVFMVSIILIFPNKLLLLLKTKLGLKNLGKKL